MSHSRVIWAVFLRLLPLMRSVVRRARGISVGFTAARYPLARTHVEHGSRRHNCALFRHLTCSNTRAYLRDLPVWGRRSPEVRSVANCSQPHGMRQCPDAPQIVNEPSCCELRVLHTLLSSCPKSVVRVLQTCCRHAQSIVCVLARPNLVSTPTCQPVSLTGSDSGQVYRHCIAVLMLSCLTKSSKSRLEVGC